MSKTADERSRLRRVVVDDTRTVVWGCTLVRTVDQALALIADVTETLDELWLDFDLGFDSDRQRVDVMPLVEFMVERSASGNPVKVKKVLIHSANLHGSRQVRRALEAAGYHVAVRHWAELRRPRQDDHRRG